MKIELLYSLFYMTMALITSQSHNTLFRIITIIFFIAGAIWLTLYIYPIFVPNKDKSHIGESN